ncbi:HK97-gp10 family putative phage morphogenesis protein [Mesorhizobium sp. SB112]|uniref:HK97-gp10 family putative phage morphogenesis protein n=1 Tax=Mesorhizobium sp. SB112 TaxID=3151853 RepID=UPI003265CF3D
MAQSPQLARLQKRLNAIPIAAKRAVELSMEKSAQEIVALAKRLCPVDQGELRDSIGWTWGDAPEGTIVLAATKGAVLRITIYAGSDAAFYARWVEFGTATALPQPFFLPSYRLLKKRTSNRTKRAISKAVKETWRA